MFFNQHIQTTLNRYPHVVWIFGFIQSDQKQNLNYHIFSKLETNSLIPVEAELLQMKSDTGIDKFGRGSFVLGSIFWRKAAVQMYPISIKLGFTQLVIFYVCVEHVVKIAWKNRNVCGILCVFVCVQSDLWYNLHRNPGKNTISENRSTAIAWMYHRLTKNRLQF